MFEQSVGFLAKYYFGKKLSSNIILQKLPNLYKWFTFSVTINYT